MKLLSRCSTSSSRESEWSRRYCTSRLAGIREYSSCCALSLPNYTVCMNLIKILNIFAQIKFIIRGKYYFRVLRAYQFCKISPVFSANAAALMYKSERAPSRRGRYPVGVAVDSYHLRTHSIASIGK